MKKFFTILALFKLLLRLRDHVRGGRHRDAFRGRPDHERSRDYYPLYAHRRPSRLERPAHRFISRRSY